MSRETPRRQWGMGLLMVLGLATLFGQGAVAPEMITIIGSAGEVPYVASLPQIDGEIESAWGDAYHARKLIRTEAGDSIWTDIYLMHDDQELACAVEYGVRAEYDGTFSGWGFIDNGDNIIWNAGDDIVIAEESGGHAAGTGIDYFYRVPDLFELDASQDAFAAVGWSRSPRGYIMEFKKRLRSSDPFDVFLEPCMTFLFVVGFDVSLGCCTMVDEGWVAIKIHLGLPPLVPGCSVTPTRLDFGTVSVGTSTTRQVTVANTGQTPLSVAVTENCPEFSVLPTLLQLSPGSSSQLSVTYTPTASGYHACPIALSLPCDDIIAVGTAEEGCPDAACDCPSRVSEDEVSDRVLRAKQCIDAAGSVCADSYPPPPAYYTYLSTAEVEWQAMTLQEKKDLLMLIGQERLGRPICLRFDGPDAQVQNPARVTADGDTIVMTWGGTYFGLDNRAGVDLSVLDSKASWSAYFQQYYPASVPPPPPGLTDSWPVPSYSSLLDFYCYELEVARIRYYINCFCKDPAARAGILTLMSQVDATIPFFADHSRQVEAYAEFMRRVRAQEKGLPYDYFASWMFEYILANGGALPTGCDMPYSFCGPNAQYDQNISEDLPEHFIHDIDAEALGELHCPCCGCGVGYPEEVVYEL